MNGSSKVEYSSVRPRRLALSFFLDFLADARKVDRSINCVANILIFTCFALDMYDQNYQVLVSSVRIHPAMTFVLKPEYKPATDGSADPWRGDGVVKDQSPINPSHSVPVTQLIGAGASDRRETLADCWSMVHGIGSHLRRRTWLQRFQAFFCGI